MAGGLLNIVAYGNQNIILNGNPKKTFFKTTYAKYTNFGLQKFRVDFDGLRNLRMNEESKFSFKIPRYAELLLDTYIVITLPTIWSTIIPPRDINGVWAPYDFRWIENLGTMMIKEINISVGGQLLQSFTGKYLLALVQRDFSESQKQKYDEMTGNTKELNDPGNAFSRVNVYPNAYYVPPNEGGAEPSIRGRKLFIPINSWFTLSNKMAFPLISLQYNELHIDVTLRAVRDLIQIRDVTDATNNFPLVQPNFNDSYQQFYRFLQTPPDIDLTSESYQDKRTGWNADIHLMCTYGFLTNEESKVFAAKEQKYLIKTAYEWNYYNVTGTQRINLENTLGMVSSWMMIFQRSDINLRNEWSNYYNWPYNYLPFEITPAPLEGKYYSEDLPEYPTGIGPGTNPQDEGTTSGLYITGNYHVENHKNILESMAILLDGTYRENLLDSGVYNYVEKYVRTSGGFKDGLYLYNFCLHTDPFDLQPSGAMNLSKFKDIQLEFTTYVPPLDKNAAFYTICDPSNNELIGVNKQSWQIYDYNYDLTILEERYNILTFVGGNCALMYAR
jgi:hypothetical protein